MSPRRRKQLPLAGDGGIAIPPLRASVTKVTDLRKHKACGATKNPGSLSLRPDSVPRDAAAGEKEEEPKEEGEKAAGASQLERKRGKPPPFVRIWSGADEVRILESLSAYVEVHRSLPPRGELCKVVGEQHLDKKEFDVTEIYEKVRRLKTRYEKLRVGGAPPPPDDNGEELRKYELSEKIWGKPLRANKKESPALDEAPDTLEAPASDKAPDTLEAPASDKAPDTHARRGFEELRRLYSHLAVSVEQISGANQGFLKMAFELIDDATAGKLDAKLKRLRVSEAKTELNGNILRAEVLSTLIGYMD